MPTQNAIPTAEDGMLNLHASAAPSGYWRTRWIAAMLAGLLLVALSLHQLHTLHASVERQWLAAGELPFAPDLIAGEGELIVASDSARGLWLITAKAVRQVHVFATKPSALGVDAETQRIYAGDALGILTILEMNADQVVQRHSRQLPGRIVALSPLSEGQLAVCHGLSASGPDYFIQILSDPVGAGLGDSIPLGFCTRLMTFDANGHIWFATMNSRLGRVGITNRLILEQRPTALVPGLGSSGGVYVLDRRGRIAYVNAQQEITWTREISRDGLTFGRHNPDTETLLVGDKAGNLFLLDESGRKIAGWAPGARSNVASIHSQLDQYKILHADGHISRIAPHAFKVESLTQREHVLSLLGFIGLTLASGSSIMCHSYFSMRVARLARAMHRRRIAYLLLLPTLSLLAVFCYWPAFSAMLYAFMRFSLTEPPRWVGLDNFRLLANDPYVWVGMRNLMILLVTGIIKTLTMPLLVAELIYWLMNERAKHWLRTSFVLPTVVPGLIGIMLWKMIYQPEGGLLNETLRVLGLSQLARPWLGDEQLAIWAIVVAGFPWIGVFPFLIFLGGLINVPRDLFEAANVDGISVWQRFWKIDLPLIRPQLKLLLTFTFIGCIQDFTSVLVFTMGGPGKATFVPALQMFLQTSQTTNLGYASAIGIFLFGLVMLATLLILSLFRTERE